MYDGDAMVDRSALEKNYPTKRHSVGFEGFDDQRSFSA